MASHKSGATTPAANPPVAAVVVAKPARAAVKAVPESAVSKPKPIPAAPVAATPEPVAPIADPAPVETPVETQPAPAVAPATATTQKEDLMETVNTATDQGQAQAKAMFNDANDRAKSAMEKGSKLIEDMNAFSKGNLEAVVESSKIAAKGAEDVARYTTDYARGAVEKANATAKQFAAVKSPTELFKLQGDLAKEAMDSMMAETAKFTENYLKLLGEIAQPLSNRVAVAAEKMKIAA